MPNISTRRKTGHFCLGQPAPLPELSLPTEAEVYNYIGYVKQQIQLKNNNFSNSSISESDIFKRVANDVISIWSFKGNLPTIGEKQVIRKVQQVKQKGKDLLKIPIERRKKLLDDLDLIEEVGAGTGSEFGVKGGSGGSAKKAKTKDSDFLHGLFDICSCKCSKRDICTCPKSKKINQMEWNFLVDQRTEREMFIGNIDKKVTEAWHDNQKRKDAFENQARVENMRCESVRNEREQELIEFMNIENSDQYDIDTEQEDETIPAPSTKSSSQESSNQNRMILACFIAEVDRYQVSDRAAAALATGLLKDLGFVSDSDQRLVVDRYKVKRERRKRQADRKRKRKEETLGGIKGLGFDGKKDKNTKVLDEIEVDGKMIVKQAVKTEEHISFVEEPSGKYLDHVSVDAGQGTGRDIGRVITDLLSEYDSLETLEVISADGTAVNTGYKSGAIAELERNLGRPLYWNICLKHGNELPLRHVFDKLDGGYGTSGPNSFKGDLGMEIAGDIHKNEVVPFEKIEANVDDISEEILADLSRDQKLLYRYAKAIIAGTVPADLKDQKPGPLCHSRWLTLALRLMILYTRKVHPSQALIKIIRFIIQVYIVMWFKITKFPHITMAPKHMFEMMNLIRTQPEDVMTIAMETLQHNAYHCHPENLLCAMLADENAEVRSEAVERILNLRKKMPKKPRSKISRGIRFFKPPPLDWSCTSYTNMINWDSNKVVVTEPAMTKNLDDEGLKSMLASPLSLPSYPCHTTSVERCVKLVSEASKQVYGEQARHGLILSRVGARVQRKMFETKKDYNFNLAL